MPRSPRQVAAGVCFHVLNRGNGRQPLFHKPGDYDAFVAILAEAMRRHDVELFSWCVLPNHWHLVLRPRRKEALAKFMRWLTVTHVRRHHGSAPGHLYQGRYKSFPVEEDDYFLALCRYVEANPLRAKLVSKAEQWKWSSLRQREARAAEPALAPWPVDRPRAWAALVNEPIEPDQRERVQASLKRGRPLGSAPWVRRTAARLGLESTLNPRGRPRKPEASLSKRQRQRRAHEAEERQKGK